MLSTERTIKEEPEAQNPTMDSHSQALILVEKMIEEDSLVELVEKKTKEELSVELQNSKKEYKLLENKYGELVLENLLTKSKFKACQRERDELRERLTSIEKNYDELVFENLLINDKLKVYQRVFEEKKEQGTKLGGEREGRNRNRDSEGGKRKAEADSGFCKKKFGKLQLEEENGVFMKLKGEVGEANVVSNEEMGETGLSIIKECQNGKNAGSSCVTLDHQQTNENLLICYDNNIGMTRGSSPCLPQSEASGGLNAEGTIPPSFSADSQLTFDNADLLAPPHYPSHDRPHSVNMAHVIKVEESGLPGSEMEYIRKELASEAVNMKVPSMPSSGLHEFGRNTDIGEDDILLGILESENYDDDGYNPGNRKMKQLQELNREPKGFLVNPFSYVPASLVSRQFDEQNSKYHPSKSFLGAFDCSTPSSRDSEEDDIYVENPSSVPKVSAKFRMKRNQTGDWALGPPAVTERISSSSSHSTTVKKQKKKPSVVPKKRTCSHCGVQHTPQWRQGPDGRKTLCNACGVRYKSGRLFPEYRPIGSPTFSSDLHSNHHRAVLEMRQKKMCSTTLDGTSCGKGK